MTSQILAIFYLNDLDHYIKEVLKAKYYLRYMDDGLIISDDKEYLKKCLNDIRIILKRDFNLSLNDKTKIFTIREGVEFLGFIFTLRNKKLIVKLKTQTKKRFKRKIRKLKRDNSNSFKHVVGSYHGHLNYANSKNLFYEIVKKV